MGHSKHLRSLRVLLPAIIFLCQCGPKVENLAIDPEFKKVPLNGSSIIIGGVTSLVSKDRSADIDTELGSQLFRDRMGERLPAVNFIPVNVTKEILGDQDYWHFLENFNLTMMADGVAIQKLSQRFGSGPYYLALARLESYSSWNSRGETKDTTGAVLNKYLQSHRKLVAKFALWKLDTYTQVWSGQITGVATATNNYPQRKDIDFSELGILGDIIDAAEEEDRRKEEKDYVYPDYPSFAWTTENLFNSFAKALEKK